MTLLHLDNISVHFPVYGTTSKSAKLSLMNTISGGRLSVDGSGAKIVKALNEVSFTAKRGDRIALLGSNGAGKTTLLRTLIGTYPPTHGSIKVSGKISSLIDMGLGINGDLTGRENIKIRGLLMGMRYRDICEKIEKITEFSELDDFIDLPVRTYSTGMTLRLAFSIATTITSEILIMDEWLSVGDAAFIDKANSRLAAIVASSEIMVLATHSRATAKANCNRAILLESGTVKMHGEFDEVADYYWGSH